MNSRDNPLRYMSIHWIFIYSLGGVEPCNFPNHSLCRSILREWGWKTAVKIPLKLQWEYISNCWTDTWFCSPRCSSKETSWKHKACSDTPPFRYNKTPILGPTSVYWFFFARKRKVMFQERKNKMRFTGSRHLIFYYKREVTAKWSDRIMDVPTALKHTITVIICGSTKKFTDHKSEYSIVKQNSICTWSSRSSQNDSSDPVDNRSCHADQWPSLCSTVHCTFLHKNMPLSLNLSDQFLPACTLI